jgi:hypothetical protein
MTYGDLLLNLFLAILAFLAAATKKYSSTLKDLTDGGDAAVIAMSMAMGLVIVSLAYNEYLFAVVASALLAVEAIWFILAYRE